MSRSLRPEEVRRQALVSPKTWQSPTSPPDRYALIVIGGGTAGLVTAAAGAILGARVALIEKHALGGDCLNTGCVPSKALIRAARAVADVRAADRFGIRVSDVEIDFAAVMQHVREARASIATHDAATRFRDLGVDIYFGEARFKDKNTIIVGERSLRFRNAVIASGARAFIPPIEGLAEAGFHTNESIFEIEERPPRLLVIGAGPIGCELAQSFSRLGSRVTVVEMLPQCLPNEDPEAAQVLADTFEKEGIDLHTKTSATRVEIIPGGKRVTLEGTAKPATIEVDEILVAVGRAPNVEGLGHDRVGVSYDRAGIKVNDRLQTTNRRIFAAGDICLPQKFTHTADAAARIVVQNALFPGRAKHSKWNIPWCTYTSPEIAGVGMTARVAVARGVAFESVRVAFDDVDRALLEGSHSGFVRILVKQGSDRILGASIVGEHAGELISEIALAMTAGLGLGVIARTIHPYPTRAEAIRKAADQLNRNRLTPAIRRWLQRWFRWTGR